MKKLFILPFIFSGAFTCVAQHSFVGDWNGLLHAGKELPIVMHIKDDDSNVLSGTWDSPLQKAMGMKCSGVKVTGDSVFVVMKNIGGDYKGVFVDNESINGMWSQRGASMPLNLKRGDYVQQVVNRPQTPKPPFDYISEDVVYHNAANTQDFGATITIPKGEGPFPALLLITGSGLENRDEEIFDHKPFAVIADYLTKRGYVVLRVDDRTKGKSTGDVVNATSEDFAKDVMVSLDYLKGRKEVNKKKIGLAGHSEGGMIAPMVAAKRKDVSFVIMLAGPGIKVSELMEKQNEAVERSAGLNESVIKEYLILVRGIIQTAINAKDTAAIRAGIAKDVNTWLADENQDVVEQATGIKDDATERSFVEQVVPTYQSAWFRYFLAYDPAPNLKQLTCRVLAIGGSKDIQVTEPENLDGIKKALANGKTKKYDVVQLEGLNHLFQTCKKCSVEEYGELEETIAPVALQTIGDWLDKNVK